MLIAKTIVKKRLKELGVDRVSSTFYPALNERIDRMLQNLAKTTGGKTLTGDYIILSGSIPARRK